jgi:hypothetical protein
MNKLSIIREKVLKSKSFKERTFPSLRVKKHNYNYFWGLCKGEEKRFHTDTNYKYVLDELTLIEPDLRSGKLPFAQSKEEIFLYEFNSHEEFNSLIKGKKELIANSFFS